MYKKKILVFVNWFLPGYRAGGPIRSISNMIDHLGSYYDFFIVTSNTDYHEKEPYSGIKSNEWNVLHNGHKVFYLSKQSENVRTIRNILEEVPFDVLYLNSMFSLSYSLIPLWLAQKLNRKKEKKFKIILAPRGMLAAGALSVKPLKKKVFLALIKRSPLLKDIIFHATSEFEKEDIAAYFKNQIKLAPNLPKLFNCNTFTPLKKKKDELRLITVARISPEKNLKYTLQVLREVKFPLSLNIYGTIHDMLYWKECTEIIDELPDTIQVKHHGEIPNHLLPAKLNENHFLILPTLGENYGHIIIESLSARCPVLISNRTPWKNLKQKRVGWDLPLERPDLFLDVLKDAYCMDETQYEDMCKQAFVFANEISTNENTIESNKLLFN